MLYKMVICIFLPLIHFLILLFVDILNTISGYYVGYVRGDVVLASNCLRLEPTWMTERRDLGMFSLVDIFIPATHDAGAWGEYDPNMSISESKV
jgi:hypothetical protein